MLLPGFARTLGAFATAFPAALAATLALSEIAEAVQEVKSGCVGGS